MKTDKDSVFKNQLASLAALLREEQRILLEEAASFDGMPNKNLLRQIAELELNIMAVDNNIEELS